MDNNIELMACAVCGGAGGWKIETTSPFDNNWLDCLYCEGNGYYEAPDFETRTFLLSYLLYKKVISDLLTDLIGDVISFETTDRGKSIKIKFAPYNKQVLTDFIGFCLRLSSKHPTLTVNFYQKYAYKEKSNRLVYNWEVELISEKMNDLDGFIDIIKFWDKQVVF